MAAAGTLVATVQKLSVRIVRLSGGGVWFQGCKPFACGVIDIKHLCCMLSNCCGTTELS